MDETQVIVSVTHIGRDDVPEVLQPGDERALTQPKDPANHPPREHQRPAEWSNGSERRYRCACGIYRFKPMVRGGRSAP
jgi:hypothetical protein